MYISNFIIRFTCAIGNEDALQVLYFIFTGALFSGFLYFIIKFFIIIKLKVSQFYYVSSSQTRGRFISCAVFCFSSPIFFCFNSRRVIDFE